MKNILFVIALLSLISCTSAPKNNLHWAGIYEGVVPCADCMGIKTTLTLNKNKTYTLIENYQTNKKTPDIKTYGTFNFVKNSHSLIHLKTSNNNDRYFFLDQYTAELRDTQGNPITSSLKTYLILNKIKTFD